MDPGTVHCAAILIYIRGLHPSLNQGTTSICYLNDKQLLQEWSAERGRRRKGGQTNSDFNPAKTQGPRAMTLMNKGSSTGPNRHDGCHSVPLIG